MFRLHAALLSLILALGTPLAAQEPVNVLWLTVEDMSPWLACYGDDTVPTPNLDRLAAESVRYANAFATSPVCAAARSSLITGMYATRIGTMHQRTGSPSRAAIERNPDSYAEIPTYEGVPPAFVRCFPEWLRARGYYCTNNAKTDYQFRAPETVWDESGNKAHWRDRPSGRPFFAVFNHGGTHESQAFPEARRRPSVVDPEVLSIPPLYPDTSAVRDALARTYDNIAAMDRWVGERLAELEEAGLADSTVVFFFSDHGVGLPRGKRSPYDLGTRVPLLVRFPDGEGAGSVESRVVSFIDFGPSVLSLAGMEPDERLDGIPFLGPHSRPGRGLAFAHADRFDSVYDHARAVSDGRFRYVRNLTVEIPYLIPNVYRETLALMGDLYALQASGPQRPEQWQIAARTRQPEELYDSQQDPWEVHNLIDAPEQAETVEGLRQALDDWMKETADLGCVLPEGLMVAEHLWPEGHQPVTAEPSMSIEDGRVRLACDTPGASIGYRLEQDASWTVYTSSFPVVEAPQLEVLTHRIGYAPVRKRFDLR